MRQTSTDYLVIGSGTAGLAFADTLIAEDPEAHVTIVDRRGKPGGHWNDAYSFVTLHQPSAFYGVNSLELGSGLIDTRGMNEGLCELASGPEISGYFDRVMTRGLLASGRVSYHPICNYLGDGQFESILSGARTQVSVRRKVVDATYLSPSVPATHRRGFRVGEGVAVVPPGALPGLWHAFDGKRPPRRFVVIGAGKTAMDTCSWLVQSGTEPDAITWVVPRDSWLLNRATTQNAPAFFDATLRSQAAMMEAFAQANSIADLYLRLEACSVLLRIHPERTPTMFHLATITPLEAELLRGIRKVLRLGRVQALEASRMTLDEGEVAVEPGTLFVDSTASAVEPRPLQPIFQEGRIVLQWCGFRSRRSARP
ncbi:MAG: NAD(P)-binding protein [Caldimonas sp.]